MHALMTEDGAEQEVSVCPQGLGVMSWLWLALKALQNMESFSIFNAQIAIWNRNNFKSQSASELTTNIIGAPRCWVILAAVTPNSRDLA